MKKLDDFYFEVRGSEVLKVRLIEALKNNEIDAFLKENEVDATVEEAKAFIVDCAEKANGECGDKARLAVISFCSLGVVCAISAAKRHVTIGECVDGN